MLNDITRHYRVQHHVFMKKVYSFSSLRVMCVEYLSKILKYMINMYATVCSALTKEITPLFTNKTEVHMETNDWYDEETFSGADTN